MPQDGSTPLHYACDGGHVKVVEMLLKHGADAEAKDNVSTAPLSSPLDGPIMAYLYCLLMMMTLYLYVMPLIHHATE